jgi:hypothetical protein
MGRGHRKFQFRDGHRHTLIRYFARTVRRDVTKSLKRFAGSRACGGITADGELRHAAGNLYRKRRFQLAQVAVKRATHIGKRRIVDRLERQIELGNSQSLNGN